MRNTSLIESFAVDGVFLKNLQQDRGELARVGNARQLRALNEHPGPPEYGYDAAFYRPFGKVEYRDQLAAALHKIDCYANLVQSNQDLILSGRPILRDELSYLRKNTQRDFFKSLRFERTWRSRFGLLVPDQCERPGLGSRQGRYVPPPAFWHAVDVPCGCHVELPPCFTYWSYFINNPPRGLWTMLATKWAIRIAGHILWEANDRLRLWHVPNMIRYSILDLDLSDVFGPVRNAREAIAMIDVIEWIDWNAVPAKQMS